MLYLKEANYEDIEKEYLFIRDIPADENGFTNSLCGVSREDFEKQALPEMINHSRGIGLPIGYVPCTSLFLWCDAEIVGLFRIRHYLTDELRFGAGHIGYFIAKEHRAHGYATAGLALTLEVARKTVPEDEIYLRVDKTNPASLAVMLKNGGYIAGEDKDKYYVRINK